jgi:hypothetical protein
MFNATPPATLHSKIEKLYQLHRRLGGLQDQSGQVRKIYPHEGFGAQRISVQTTFSQVLFFNIIDI